ncbi:MAG: response regulator [Eubacteriales bacterium]|nr:response regulator [Eubacteriales bacterium]
MYKILLADNEGVVLESLAHIIYNRYGEACDIRMAKTARYARILARKFIPDIAVINIQMPGMHNFDIIREIRSYHIKCVFITVSAQNRQFYQTEAKSLNILAHLVKPLFREKFVPVLEIAAAQVVHSQKLIRQNRMIQSKFDTVVPVVEHGLIHQMFFADSYAASLNHYKTLLGISQNYGRIVSLTFGELPLPPARQAQSASAEMGTGPADTGAVSKDKNALQNLVGSSVHLQKDYMKFREIVKESFPLAIIGPVMGNHVLFLLPCWKETETAKEKKEFLQSSGHLTEALEDAFDGMSFFIEAGEIQLLCDIRL